MRLHDKEWYLWKSDKSMKQEPKLPLIIKSQKTSHLILSPRNCSTVKEIFFTDFFRTGFWKVACHSNMVTLMSRISIVS